MLERVSEQHVASAAAATDAQALEQLRQQIELHEKEDSSRSILKTALGSVSSVFVKDDVSLSHLKDFYRNQQQNLKEGKGVDAQAIQALVKSDQEAVHLQNEILHYGSGFLKTAGLFMRGRVGLAGTVAMYALDQIRPGDSFKEQLADAALGTAKGGLLKGAFHFMGDKPVGIAAKGVGLGVSSRVLELGLTRQTYLDSKTGEFSLSKGLTDTVHGTLNKTALAADVVIFGAAHGMLRGGNRLVGGAIDKSPLATTMLTGTTFGLSAGATGEILRQNAADEDFDLGKIIKRGLIQAAVDTVATAPGGLQADPGARGRINTYMRTGVDNMRAQAEAVKTAFLNLADSIGLDGGLVPAYAGVPSGIRVWVPRPVRNEALTTRPVGYDPRKDGIMNMIDGATGPRNESGANIDGIIGAPERTEPALRGTPEKVAPAPHDTSHHSAPAEARRGEKLLLGDGQLAVSSAVRVRTPQEKVAFEQFQDLAVAAAVPGAEPSARQKLFQFLKEHPELEVPVRQYEGILFESLTTGYKPGELAAEQMAERKNIISMIGEFYKPDRARIFVDTQEQGEQFKQLLMLLGGLKMEGAAATLARQAVFEFLGKHPEVHEVVRRYAASSNDPRVVTVLDDYFGTRHLDALRELNAWRLDPFKRAAAPVALEPSEVVKPAVEPQHRIEEPLPADATAAKKMVADPAAGQKESGQLPEALSAPAPEPSSGSPLVALAKVKPPGVTGAAGEPAGKSEYAAVAPKPERTDAASVPEPGNPVAPAPTARQTVSASEIARGLADPSSAVRHKTARILGDHLAKLSDAEFVAWKQVAGEAILMGDLLKRPDIAALPSPVLKRFLSKMEVPASAEPPEWAKEFVEKSRLAAAEREQQSGRPPRPPRLPRDTMQDRLAMLQKTMDAFKDFPEVAAKLVALGAQDKATLDGILFSLGNPRFGEAYKALVRSVVPHLESVEPLKYLFQFIKEGDADGAFVALQHARPKPKVTAEELERRVLAEREQKAQKTLEEIELEIQAVKEQLNGEFDPVEVAAEAEAQYQALKKSLQVDVKTEVQRLFEIENKSVQDQWQIMQKLVHDIITGNVQAPRRDFGGRGRDGGDRRGRGPGRGDRQQ